MPSDDELSTSMVHSGDVSFSRWTRSKALSTSWSRATMPMSGRVWATTSAKNSYCEHSASSQIRSIPSSTAFKLSRVASQGSTIARRSTLSHYVCCLVRSCDAATGTTTIHIGQGPCHSVFCANTRRSSPPSSSATESGVKRRRLVPLDCLEQFEDFLYRRPRSGPTFGIKRCCVPDYLTEISSKNPALSMCPNPRPEPARLPLNWQSSVS